MNQIGINVFILWCLVALVKDNQAERQYEGNYFDNRGPPIGAPDMIDASMPRIYSSPGVLEQGLVGKPNPLGNAENKMNEAYKELDFHKITGKDLISQPISVKKHRPSNRPKPNYNELEGQNMFVNGFGENERLPNSIQPNSNDENIDAQNNYMHDGPPSNPWSPTNGYNKQITTLNQPSQNGPSNEPTYGQCLSMVNEKEKHMPGAVGPADWYAYRLELSQYLLPLLLGLYARNNNGFDDLTSYRRLKNGFSPIKDSVSLDDLTNVYASVIDRS